MNRHEWITQAARLRSEDQAFALVTVLSAQAPTSGKAGDKAVVMADGQIHGWIGGGCAQPAVLKTVRSALLDGQTPEEIALSVLSSVVAARRARQAKPAQVQAEPVQAFSDSAAMPEAAQDELVVAGVSAVATAVKSSCCGG